MTCENGLLFMRSEATCHEWPCRARTQLPYCSDPVPWLINFRSTGVSVVRAETLSSYLDIKARSRLLMKGSFVFSINSRNKWARCFLNSLSNMADPNNILKAECYPGTTRPQNRLASGMWISR